MSMEAAVIVTADATVEAQKQHLIDPEICIRCNTCEETCPSDAITHDARNYVVDAAKCNACMACIGPCPTGAIDNWRIVARGAAHGVDAQLGWDVLPPDDAPATAPAVAATAGAVPAVAREPRGPGATVPPASAAHPQVNLHSPRAPARAIVAGNFRITAADAASDTRHIVLDFGATPFPVLEGQSIGIVPPGVDADGRAHVARRYSVSSPRDGERAGYNNVAITVKRVTADHGGRPAHGHCSNYLCDLAKGDAVDVIGPFGDTFLMPDDPAANLVMICTGTGSAPMRAMTERRRRLAHGEGAGRLMLFFGARSAAELPYFGPLTRLPRTFIDVNLAFSRTPGEPKRYVQDRMRERAVDLAALLADPRTHVYVCGLAGMEEGVLAALADAVRAAGRDWDEAWDSLRASGRLHFETY